MANRELEPAGGHSSCNPSLTARWGPTGGHDAIPTANGRDPSEFVGDGPDGGKSGGGEGGDALHAGAWGTRKEDDCRGRQI